MYPQGGTYRGSSCVAEFADGSWKSPVIWGGSTNYSMADPSNANKVIAMPGLYRDQSKGYDTFNKGTQNGNCVQTLRTYSTTYFLMDTGKVWAGGYNNNGQVGCGHTSTEYRMVPVQFLDSPTTTSEITYKIYSRVHTNGNNVTLGWGSSTSSTHNLTFVTIMEIAQ